MPSEERVRKLVDQAHGYCFIANSPQRAPMRIEPTVDRR